MYFSRRIFLTSLVIGAGAILGCGDPASKGMQNMQTGGAPPVHKDLQLKKGKKTIACRSGQPEAPAVMTVACRCYFSPVRFRSLPCASVG